MGNNHELSERERDIVKLVATGVSNKEIAQKLNITTNTVKVHLKNIFAKIGVLSRTEATLYAIEHGIVDAPGNRVVQTEPDTANWKTFFTKRQWFIIPALTLILLATIIVPWYLMRQQTISPTVTQVALFSPTPLPRWQEQAPMPEGRAGMAAAAYENQIYIFAGETEAGITNTSLRYDTIRDKWYRVSEKPTPVTDVQAVMIGEKIYVPGGWTGVSASQSLEVYDIRSDTWNINASIPEPRSGYALATLEGRLYLFGGWDGERIQNSIYSYDPLDNDWSEMNPMPESLVYMSAVTSGNKIFLLGGWNGKQASAQAYQYNPARDQSGDQLWSSIPLIPYPMCRHSVSEISGYIFVVGGSFQDCKGSLITMDESNYDSHNYMYTTHLSDWYLFEDTSRPIGFSGILVSINNKIYQIGGVIMGKYQKQNQSYLALYSSSLPIFDSP